MILRRRQLAALAAGAALLGGIGCGSEEEEPAPGIPRSAADALSRELDLVQERLDVTRDQGQIGSCNDIDSKSYPDIERLVSGLPADTDADVRRALQRSVDRLKELTESECSELAKKIEERRKETTPEVTTPPPAPVQPQTTPEPPETDEEPEEKPKEKGPKKEKGQNDGGTSPQNPNAPGQNGGGQPAPAPEGE